MTKATVDWPIILVFAIGLLLVSVGIFFAGLGNVTNPPTPSDDVTATECRSNLDCSNNENGLECLQIFDLENNEPFCGCRFNENCTGGKICGSNFRCQER